MSSFGGDNLFDSGPHRFHVGGLALRHALQPPDATAASGVRVTPSGRTGRLIRQRGDLIADDAVTLDALRVAIESRLDGVPRVLVDDLGREWNNTILLALDPSPVQRLGTRLRLPYRAEYLQLVTA